MKEVQTERGVTVFAIDPKYGIEIRDGKPVLVKTKTGEPIPEDEPLILFRGRDQNALHGALTPYEKRCEADGCTDFHLEGIRNRINAFLDFKCDFPERMKQPGITRGE